jgi:translocation and assembly module TamB
MEVPELPVAVSPDVVFTDTLGREPPPPYKVSATLKVALGEDVFFSGFGFTSFFEGELAVRQPPHEIAVGNGELRFREGRFYSYGQNLTIHDGQGGKAPGRITFAGPVDNPSIALKAYRMADDGTEAGLDVTGPMKEPRVTVYSEPAMEQANALSYLMFGRGLEQGSQSEKNQVGYAAMYLGGNMVATRMATKVGLDEARIEPGSSGSMSDASLLVGKYLSPRLYAAYGLSLFDRSSKFRLRYLISRALSVQTECDGRGCVLEVRSGEGWRAEAPAIEVTVRDFVNVPTVLTVPVSRWAPPRRPPGWRRRRGPARHRPSQELVEHRDCEGRLTVPR